MTRIRFESNCVDISEGDRLEEKRSVRKCATVLCSPGERW